MKKIILVLMLGASLYANVNMCLHYKKSLMRDIEMSETQPTNPMWNRSILHNVTRVLQTCELSAKDKKMYTDYKAELMK